jgi:hypothetical protein
MLLKRSTHESKPSASGRSSRLVRAGLAGLVAVSAVAGLATGCLDRPVVKATPTTSNVFVDQIVQTAVDKIDLLFMIDNSVSMADKQEILKAAVPVLLGRLVSPICVDANGVPTTGSETTSGKCASQNPPSAPEFAPIGDIHIGIVSSSLGAHGGTVCSAPAATDDPATTHLNDNGELMGIQRTGLTTWNGSGFLAWDPGGKDVPPGETSATNLNTNFSAMVEATGEHGCGFESQLEGWYRFLIDPEPPANVTRVGNATVRGSSLVTNADGTTTCNGCDMNLLAQRKAFLRPDSLVAIVMLSDENDCSIRDDGVGWFVGATSHMPKATQACAANPNDKCCRSCAQNETSPPSGCMALSADPVCMGAPAGSYNTWDNLHDSLNLRCYNQKQRFGFDLLYGTDRYVGGLTASTLPLQSDGTKSVTNPLYDTQGSGKAPRDPSLVFLAGIVGVPWQDISTADSLASPTQLTYLTATELAALDANGKNRWDQLLGNAAASPPVLPSDPFMVETTDPRSGMNPNSGDAIASADSMNPQASKINGHEQHIPDLADLQYACISLLGTPKVCAAGDAACDCSGTMGSGDLAAVTAANSPLCQPPGGGAPGATQYYFKGYPGARELTVLRDFGNNAIVASICPKVTTSANMGSDPNYGYNPAVGAIINRLKDALKGKCLPRAIQKNTDGTVECEVIEAQKAGQCDCTLPGRAPADPAIYPAVFNQLSTTGTCGDAPGQAKCDQSGFCMCEITQEQAGLSACESGQTTGPEAGYCYIDDPTSPALKNCPDNQKRLLNFVSAGNGKTPAQGAIAFIACLGAPIQSVDGG